MRAGRVSMLFLSAFFGFSAAAIAGEPGADRQYSPSVGQDFPIVVYWGDTHLHTNLSPDAASAGNRQFGHDNAYRLARGEAVTAHNGMLVQLNRPLDFLVAADHSEYMGLFPGLERSDPHLLASEAGRRWHSMLQAGPGEAADIMNEFARALRTGQDLLASPEFQKSTWSIVTGKAEEYNQPGIFTAFIGYEWSSGRGGANLHRVVIFKDGAGHADRIVPFSSFAGDRPRELWRFLANYERSTGGEVLAIPHNSNTSAGLMFATVDSDGNEMTTASATARARWEPLAEVTQIKGDSETHPYVSPGDEFADYESLDQYAGYTDRLHEDTMFAAEYARPALRNGLALFSRLSVNPFKFGMIGSTDSHTGIPSADENNFWGKFSWHEPNATRAGERFVNIPAIKHLEWQMAASGYAAVWAMENTRESLFAALKRKETYATTGPRITVRFFGGWDFAAADLARPDWVVAGYANGVPMGGDLPAGGATDAPAFLVSALKDPYGANLDRVQIVKGWLLPDGGSAERVYDVALSDNRQVNADTGKAPPVGSTVDVANATWSNTIGAVHLATVWRDPQFDPAVPAFYYARIIEIPTPRWTAYDARFFGAQMPPEAPMTTQERAYTSPIWYVP